MTRIGAGVSLQASAPAAGYEAALRAREELGEAQVDLACVFATPEHLDAAPELTASVRELLTPRHLLGCVAQGVVSGERELEAGPGVSVWAASPLSSNAQRTAAASFCAFNLAAASSSK